MDYNFVVPENKKIDLIIDTDAKNEADDQFAIVHALLSPKLRVKGIVATQFSKRRTNYSMIESYNECKKILSIMGIFDVPILKGNVEELKLGEECELSQGAQFIIEQAKQAEEYINIAVMGALTNVAAALVHDPTISKKIKVHWVGGKANIDSLDCLEANAKNDPIAVNEVMIRCENIVQIPEEVYSLLQVSLAEIEYKVKNCGTIGNFLFSQLNEFNYQVNRPWANGESWALGDNSVISVLINPNSAKYTERKAFTLSEDLNINPVNKEIMLVTDLNYRYTLEDLFSKLNLYSK